MKSIYLLNLFKYEHCNDVRLKIIEVFCYIFCLLLFFRSKPTLDRRTTQFKVRSLGQSEIKSLGFPASAV